MYMYIQGGTAYTEVKIKKYMFILCTDQTTTKLEKRLILLRTRGISASTELHSPQGFRQALQNRRYHVLGHGSSSLRHSLVAMVQRKETTF